jgi:hypothetical protein
LHGKDALCYCFLTAQQASRNKNFMSGFSVIFSSFLGGERGRCDPAKSAGKMTKPKAFWWQYQKRAGLWEGNKPMHCRQNDLDIQYFYEAKFHKTVVESSVDLNPQARKRNPALEPDHM